jgi:hypothetical protein
VSQRGGSKTRDLVERKIKRGLIVPDAVEEAAIEKAVGEQSNLPLSRDFGQR